MKLEKTTYRCFAFTTFNIKIINKIYRNNELVYNKNQHKKMINK